MSTVDTSTGSRSFRDGQSALDPGITINPEVFYCFQIDGVRRWVKGEAALQEVLKIRNGASTRGCIPSLGVDWTDKPDHLLGVWMLPPGGALPTWVPMCKKAERARSGWLELSPEGGWTRWRPGAPQGTEDPLRNTAPPPTNIVLDQVLQVLRRSHNYSLFLATSAIDRGPHQPLCTDKILNFDISKDRQWIKVVTNSGISPQELLSRFVATGFIDRLPVAYAVEGSVASEFACPPNWRALAKKHYVASEQEISEALRTFEKSSEALVDRRFDGFAEAIKDGIREGLVWVDITMSLSPISILIDGAYQVAYALSRPLSSSCWRDAIGNYDRREGPYEMAEHCLKCAWSVGMSRRRGWYDLPGTQQ